MQNLSRQMIRESQEMVMQIFIAKNEGTLNMITHLFLKKT